MKDHTGLFIFSGFCLLILAASLFAYISSGSDGWAVPIIFSGAFGVTFGGIGIAEYLSYRDKLKPGIEAERRRGYEATRKTALEIVGSEYGTGIKNIAEALVKQGSRNLAIVVNTGQGKHYTQGAEQFMEDVRREAKILRTKKLMRVEF